MKEYRSTDKSFFRSVLLFSLNSHFCICLYSCTSELLKYLEINEIEPRLLVFLYMLAEQVEIIFAPVVQEIRAVKVKTESLLLLVPFAYLLVRPFAHIFSKIRRKEVDCLFNACKGFLAVTADFDAGVAGKCVSELLACHGCCLSCKNRIKH